MTSELPDHEEIMNEIMNPTLPFIGHSREFLEALVARHTEDFRQGRHKNIGPTLSPSTCAYVELVGSCEQIRDYLACTPIEGTMTPDERELLRSFQLQSTLYEMDDRRFRDLAH
jgi:hypothetical protein